jgi:membrane protease YdiL (CAAX protease family)
VNEPGTPAPDGPQFSPAEIPAVSTPWPPVPPPLPPFVVPPKKPFFSWPVLVLCVILGLSTIGYQAFTSYSSSPLEELFYPAHTAARLAERLVEYYATPGSFPEIEKSVAKVFQGDPESVTNDAIRICRSILDADELTALTPNDEAGLRLVLGVILGESGRTNALAELIEESPEPSDEYLTLLRRLYLSPALVKIKVSEMLPNSSVMGAWTLDRLEARAAFLAGNKAYQMRSDVRERSEWAHRIGAAFFLIGGLGCLLGLGIIIYSLATGAGRGLPSDQLSAPWSWRDATGVLFLAAFVSWMLTWYFALLPLDFIRSLASHLYATIPLVVLFGLAHFILFQRHGLRLRDQFRIPHWPAFVGGTLALSACEFLGNTALMFVLSRWDADPNWAETIDEYLLYEDGWVQFAILLNMSVMAPFMEEMEMRRIAHATLRRHTRIFIAAALSATLFAFLHFYSFAGFVSVWWFGFAAALVYERTRSLPACIAGHFLTNALLGLQEILWLG